MTAVQNDFKAEAERTIKLKAQKNSKLKMLPSPDKNKELKRLEEKLDAAEFNLAELQTKGAGENSFDIYLLINPQYKKVLAISGDRVCKDKTGEPIDGNEQTLVQAYNVNAKNNYWAERISRGTMARDLASQRVSNLKHPRRLEN